MCNLGSTSENDVESRRAVLQMWNVEDDLLKVDSSRDVCCNLSVLFTVERGVCRECARTAARGAPRLLSAAA